MSSGDLFESGGDSQNAQEGTLQPRVWTGEGGVVSCEVGEHDRRVAKRAAHEAEVAARESGLNSLGVERLQGVEGLRELAERRLERVGGALVETEHTVAYGARREFVKSVHRLVADNKAAILEELTTPQVRRDFLDAIKEGAKRKDRTCIRMLAEIYELGGARQSLVAEFLARVGMATLDEIERVVDRHRGAQGMDAHQRANACVDYLVRYFDRYPERRGGLVRRFGVEVPVSSADYAVVGDALGPD